MSRVSIIIPTYNEAKNIGNLIKAITEAPINGEVVVIDDNSPDGTGDVVVGLSNVFRNLKLLTRHQKMGLGSAYKDGLKLCSGSIIVEMDADLSHDPNELDKILKALEINDIVIGSRYIYGGKIVGWKWYRKIISSIANFLARVILGLRVRDVTSGFRAYHRSVFEKIVSASCCDGFDFQIEAVYIAKKLGFKIAEVPITFTNRSSGKSKLSLSEIFIFLKSLITIRFRSQII